MKKIFLLSGFILLLSSCSTQKNLYSWDKYTTTSYNYYKKQTPESEEALMKTYQRIITKAENQNSRIAPGIYAEYGFFLMKNGKRDEGLTYITKEKELYPESTPFIDRLIKQFSE